MKIETNELLSIWAALSSELSKAPSGMIHASLGFLVDTKGGITLQIKWHETGVPPELTVVAIYWEREMWLNKETLTSMAREAMDNFTRLHVAKSK